MTRVEKVKEAQRLRAEGLTVRAIGSRLGVSRSSASAYLNDPDLSQQRARRRSYRQPCPKCGTSMDGSWGPNRPPTQCQKCAEQERRDLKYWTRKRVIAALQRYAAEHGRPPIADEWMHADPVNDYPNRGSVYRSIQTSSSPFASWADALEAAGFPRPTTARRTYGEGAMTQARSGYTILRENGDGNWEVVGTYEAHSQIVALNEALNGSEPAGRWVAVPGRYWQPRGLRPKTVYDWVEAST